MNIEQIKQKYTCLDYLGDRVIRRTATGYLARCPWREDNHPSMTATLNGEGWKDHASGQHGNIIDLVALDKHMNKSEVCTWFDTFSFPPQKNCGSKEKRDGFLFFEVVPLQSRGQFAYLHSRSINIEIAKQFLQEAHYSFEDRTDGRYLYALAYPNDLGGYELRNGLKNGKMSKSPKGITTHFSCQGAPVVVFEGLFDMLSFATLCGEVRHNYLVLNSTAMVAAAINHLKDYAGQVYLCLDNDMSGDSATRQILDQLPAAIDIRSRFAPAKDLNEYLVNLNK